MMWCHQHSSLGLEEGAEEPAREGRCLSGWRGRCPCALVAACTLSALGLLSHESFETACPFIEVSGFAMFGLAKYSLAYAFPSKTCRGCCFCPDVLVQVCFCFCKVARWALSQRTSLSVPFRLLRKAHLPVKYRQHCTLHF